MQVRRVRRKWNGWEAAIICYFSSLRIEKNRTKNKIDQKKHISPKFPLAIFLEMIYIGGVRARTLTPDGSTAWSANQREDLTIKTIRPDNVPERTSFQNSKVLNWFLVQVRRRFLLAAQFLSRRKEWGEHVELSFFCLLKKTTEPTSGYRGSGSNCRCMQPRKALWAV